MSASDTDLVVILGAGAAGLFCAMTAGGLGRRVVVLDHNSQAGKKILISGGGRANFTNLTVAPTHFHSGNPHFCTSALKRYPSSEFIALVERHGIPWHEREHGQLFCDRSAKDLVAMLVDDCTTAGVELRLGTRIDGVTRSDDGFVIATATGPLVARDLVLATGGLSIPTLGASDLGYRLAQQFGLTVTATAPALVPFTLHPDDLAMTGPLSGIAVPAEVSCNGRSFRENLLFTHGGLSGPCILQISTWWSPGDTVQIDLLPDQDLAELLRSAKRTGAKQNLPNLLATLLPRRLVTAWVERHHLPDSVHHLTEADLTNIAAVFHRWPLRPAGTEGYRKAEVTRGGISTDELSSKTMGAKNVPGLYAIGEVVDVTGWLGGYNFQWAWASGHAAGTALGS